MTEKKECYQNLEETSIPMDFIIVDSIPINLGGKIDINLLKEKANINYYDKKNVITKKLILK